MNKKVLWTVIVVIVIVAIALLSSGGSKTNAPASNNGNLPAVTSENSTPDAIVSSLAAFDAETAVTPVESDPTLTAPDQQSMSALSQSFDPNQIPNQ